MKTRDRDPQNLHTDNKYHYSPVIWDSLLEINVKHGIAIDEWVLLFQALSGCL